MKLYKFLNLVDGKIKSNHDGSEWTIGKWRIEAKPEKECIGLNACKNIIDALGYVKGNLLAKVEVKGKKIISNDKYTCEKMKIIKTWDWTKEDSIRVAIYAAELVINIYEKTYPNNKKPREAIESAKTYLKNPSTADNAAAYADYANAAAAYAYADNAAAYTDYADYAAAAAATTAANAAAAYAYAAYAAAAAAYADYATAAAATTAANAAARKKIKNKIHNYILKIKRNRQEDNR